jgi:hypothetical protein
MHKLLTGRLCVRLAAVQTTAQASENDQFAAGAFRALLMTAMARSIVPYDDLGDSDARLN